MQIRIHVKSSVVLSEARCLKEDSTQVLTISFWLWLKSLFFSLDLVLNAYAFTFQPEEAEQAKQKEPMESSKYASRDSTTKETLNQAQKAEASKPKHGCRTAGSEAKAGRGSQNQQTKEIKTTKARKKKQALTAEEVFGIQWDDDTVIYPSSNTDPDLLSLHDLKQREQAEQGMRFSEVNLTKEIPNTANATNTTNGVNTQKALNVMPIGQSQPINITSKNTDTAPHPIDFKNPPHSARWKERNLPKRKPFVPVLL